MYMKALAEEWKKRDREREIIMKKKVMLCFYIERERERELSYVLCFALVYLLRVSSLNFIPKCPVKHCHKGAGRAIKVIVSSKFIKYSND